MTYKVYEYPIKKLNFNPLSWVKTFSLYKAEAGEITYDWIFFKSIYMGIILHNIVDSEI